MLRPSFVALIALLGSAGVANAFFRVACGTPLVQERVDPIINPGQSPSNHVHTIQGASNFGPNYTYASLRNSSCTSCEVAQDLSNYWYPKLYFRDPVTGHYEAVSNGGLLVYYLQRGDADVSNGGPGLKAFPAGLKMITGSPARRSKKYPVGQGSQGELAERATQWSCLRYSAGQQGYDDNGTGFPTTDCESGLNARLHMPSCWDGVNLDSADHTSHVAYLSGLDNGVCPSTHPVPFIHIFYEVTWNVADFSSRWSAAKGDKWPFVYATGDPTGFSWHGDFQNGWDTTALQGAIDACNNPNDETGSGVTEACKYLTVNSATTADACKISPIVNEAVNGTLTRLPGCNPLQSGPGDATFYSDSNCPTNLPF